MPERVVISFVCPNCGAEVNALEGHTNVQCGYCGSRLLITERLGMPRIFSRPVVKNPRGIIKSIAGKDAKIIDLDLLFIPMIKLRAEIIGWIHGYKKGEVKKDYYYDSSGGSQTNSLYSGAYPGGSSAIGARVVGEKRVKKKVRRILEMRIDPSNFYRFGIERIKLKEKKFEPYDDNLLPQFGNVFDLPLSIKEYLKQGEDTLISNITGEYSGWDEFKWNLRAIKKSAIVYYCPVYFSRLEVAGVPYTYSIDAVSGEVLIREAVVHKKERRVIKLNPLYAIIGLAGVTISVLPSVIGRGWTLLVGLAVLFLIWELQYGTE